MSLLRTLILGVIFWVLLAPTSVFAQSHNHEGHHQKEVTSPFEAKNKNIALHCLLRSHAQNEVCPHSNSVNEKSGIILFSEDINTNSSENIQMSSEYHIYPYNKEFIEAINIEFNNINIEDDLWKYSIRKKEDEEWIEIDTEIKDHKISSRVISGGIYSIFYNPTALDPIPEKFELVREIL